MVMIYVDGDACPVKDEVLKVAERYGVGVTIVSNGGLRPSRDKMIRHVIVPKEADAADRWIVEHLVAGDVVITADILLAGLCVDKHAKVISPTGKAYNSENIAMVVAMRNLNRELRETGEISGHNRSFTSRDRSTFLQALDRELSKR